MDLKQVRKKAGLTQEDVARAVEVARESYTNIENGVRRPSVRVAKKLGKALGFDWSELFETDEKKPLEGSGKEDNNEVHHKEGKR